MIQSTPYFPFFRKKIKTLEVQLTEARGEVQEAILEKDVKAQRAKAREVRDDQQ